jgi:hypothetical protein
MTLRPCSREPEVAALLKSGHWPQSCEPELRQHVASCTTCRDTVMLKTAFQRASSRSRRAAPLGSPGLIWWRAQLRRRHAALERVSKPVTRAQLFALSIYIVAAVGFVGVQIRRSGGWLALLEHIKQSTTSHSEAAWFLASTAQNWNLMLLIPCMAAVALLGGVVLYLASDRS